MKYKKETTSKIIKLIKEGNFASVAFQAVGISNETYYRWLKTKPEFSESIKKAKAERITSLIQAIKLDDSWQSKAWALERLARDKFHLPTRAEKDLNERLGVIENKLDEYLLKKEKTNGRNFATP
jgi:hypothetical protein